MLCQPFCDQRDVTLYGPQANPVSFKLVLCQRTSTYFSDPLSFRISIMLQSRRHSTKQNKKLNRYISIHPITTSYSGSGCWNSSLSREAQISISPATSSSSSGGLIGISKPAGRYNPSNMSWIWLEHLETRRNTPAGRHLGLMETLRWT